MSTPQPNGRYGAIVMIVVVVVVLAACRPSFFDLDWTISSIMPTSQQEGAGGLLK